MSIQLTKPLVVPEYNNALVKSYIADPATLATVIRPPYTMNVQAVLTALLPGKTARVNACALNGNDLFIANSSFNSQCIFKAPNYLTRPEKAAAQAFVFTLDGNDYVGIAFDAVGNLYAAEGDFGDNHIVRYTGTAKAYPGAAAAAVDNYATRVELGNAGATSYFANLAFDAVGNLWVSDYRNHRVVAFDAANLGGAATYHVLANLSGSIPVANTDGALNGDAAHLFAEPEGIDFDGAGHLWVANNNDGGGAGLVQNGRTSLVRITPALQAAVLATAPGGTVTPAIGQSNTDFFIYQVPKLADDAGARPQFGGLQIDRAAGRIFVNEEVAGKGRGYDIATIAAIGPATAANDLDIVSTNPGNGGIALVNAQAPVVFIRDNASDAGVEPNATTAIAYESPDVWPRQNATGTDAGPGSLGEMINGGSDAHVYVRVTNNGLTPNDGSEIVRLYWAKASAGLSVPTPWNGAVPINGSPFPTPQPVPIIPAGKSVLVHFDWLGTPNPENYADKDGHFCLLAQITTPGSPEFAGFQGTNLPQNVLGLSTVAWRNIHIVGVAPMIVGGRMVHLGALVAANYTSDPMVAQIAFEVLDASAKMVTPATGRLLIAPNAAALEQLRRHRADRPFLEDVGHGMFHLLDIAGGIPRLDLRPGETLHFGVAYAPGEDARGCVVRCTQYAVDGAVRQAIGGQTFVAGVVEGYATDQPSETVVAAPPAVRRPSTEYEAL